MLSLDHSWPGILRVRRGAHGPAVCSASRSLHLSLWHAQSVQLPICIAIGRIAWKWLSTPCTSRLTKQPGPMQKGFITQAGLRPACSIHVRAQLRGAGPGALALAAAAAECDMPPHRCRHSSTTHLKLTNSSIGALHLDFVLHVCVTNISAQHKVLALAALVLSTRALLRGPALVAGARHVPVIIGLPGHSAPSCSAEAMEAPRQWAESTPRRPGVSTAGEQRARDAAAAALWDGVAAAAAMAGRPGGAGDKAQAAGPIQLPEARTQRRDWVREGLRMPPCAPCCA